MLTLYIGNKNYSSWSLRPWILLVELGIPFDEKIIPFKGAPGVMWDEYRVFSPNGKVPCLVDSNDGGDGDGATSIVVTVWDSLAICEYLADHQLATVWPPKEAKAARAWARSAASEMHSGFDTLRTVCGMNIGVRAELFCMKDDDDDDHHPSSKPQEALQHQYVSLQKDLVRVNELWTEGLERFGGPFLAGDSFTAVDAFYAPVVFRIETFGLLEMKKLSKSSAAGEISAEASIWSPASRAYYERMLGLAGMKAWAKAALAETWREQSHEDDLMSAGDILVDNRATEVS